MTNSTAVLEQRGLSKSINNKALREKIQVLLDLYSNMKAPINFGNNKSIEEKHIIDLSEMTLDVLGLPSLAETLIATKNHKKTAEIISHILGENPHGLSGSLVYGPNFSIKHSSDLDFRIQIKGREDISSIIDNVSRTLQLHTCSDIQEFFNAIQKHPETKFARFRLRNKEQHQANEGHTVELVFAIPETFIHMQTACKDFVDGNIDIVPDTTILVERQCIKSKKGQTYPIYDTLGKEIFSFGYDEKFFDCNDTYTTIKQPMISRTELGLTTDSHVCFQLMFSHFTGDAQSEMKKAIESYKIAYSSGLPENPDDFVFLPTRQERLPKKYVQKTKNELYAIKNKRK